MMHFQEHEIYSGRLKTFKTNFMGLLTLSWFKEWNGVDLRSSAGNYREPSSQLCSADGQKGNNHLTLVIRID